jgi:uncharacterized repeat protein (TIGR03803 family)
MYAAPLDDVRAQRRTAPARAAVAILIAFVAPAAVVLLPGWNTCAAAPALQTIASFNNTNGSGPDGDLLRDNAGNLYGTTVYGGASGKGTVFKLTAANNYAVTTLVSFTAATGYEPHSGVVADPVGNLYGVTSMSGSGNPYGTVYKLTAASNYAHTTLAPLNINTVGGYPWDPLMRDAAGNLYGTTSYSGPSGRGAAYRVNAADNSVTALNTFTTATSPFPGGGLVADSAGRLYGTLNGGASTPGEVYRLDPANNFALTTLRAFTSNANGPGPSNPHGSLVIDPDTGDIFGTTVNGGAFGNGSVYMLDASDNYASTTLASFDFGAFARPEAGVIRDALGNLYGTSLSSGGTGGVWKLDAANNYAFVPLATFTGTNGANPYAGLIADPAGVLYGATRSGGAFGHGTAFRITDSGFAAVVPEPATGLAVLALGGIATSRCGRNRGGTSGRRTL